MCAQAASWHLLSLTARAGITIGAIAIAAPSSSSDCSIFVMDQADLTQFHRDTHIKID